MDRYTLIESYLMDVLSHDERQAFELRLSQEEDLLADVESHAKMKLSMDVLIEDDVKAVVANLGNQSIGNLNLDKSNNENSKSKTLGVKNRRFYFGIAASLLVFACVGWWGITGLNKNDYSLAFKEFYKAPFSKQTRSGETVKNEELDAIDQQYYMAHDLIAEGKFNEAYKMFDSLKLPNDHAFEDNRTWFMAIVKLNYDAEGAMIDLEKIASDGDHKYRNQIAKLLKEIQ